MLARSKPRNINHHMEENIPVLCTLWILGMGVFYKYCAALPLAKATNDSNLPSIRHTNTWLLQE